MPSARTGGVLLDLSVALCLVLACLSGVVSEAVNLLAGFGESPGRDDYLAASITYISVAVGVGLLGPLVQIALRRARWLALVTGTGVLALLARSVQMRAQAASAEPGEYGVEVVDAVAVAALPPTSWPLIVLGLASVVALTRGDVRGSSCPAPR